MWETDKVIKEKIKRIDDGREETDKLKNFFNREFGSVPNTIWKINFTLNKNLPEFVKTQQEDAKIFEDSIGDLDLKKKIEGTGFSLGAKTVRKKDGTGGISVFPYDLAKKILVFYTDKDDVIFDPFAGHCTRGYSCFLNNRHYFGNDICVKFIEKNKEIIDKANKESLVKKDITIKYFNKDSRDLSFLPSNSFDFIFSSPPYWDLEYYGPEDEQLSNCKTYEKFLEDMTKIYKECFRLLKGKKYIVININDFRKDYKFFMYHSDTAKCLVEAGFKLHQVVVVDWGQNIGSTFVNDMYRNKLLGKQHEYLVVCRKDEVTGEYKKEDLLKKDFDSKVDEKEIEKLIVEHKGLLSRRGAIQLIEKRSKTII